MRRIGVRIVAIVASLLGGSAKAIQFQLVIDSPFPQLPVAQPRIGESGAVAYNWSGIVTQSVPHPGVYVWKNGQLQLIFDPVPAGTLSYQWGYTVPTLNKHDQIGINLSQQLGPFHAYKWSSGTGLVSLAQEGNEYSNIDNAVIADNGRVYFGGIVNGQRGIYFGPNPATDAYMPAGGAVESPSIVSVWPDNTVLALGKTGNKRGIFKGPDAVADLVLQIDPSGDRVFGSMYDFEINPSGNFLANTTILATGSRVLMKGLNPATDVYADTNGSFADFGFSLGLNAGGAVAFTATLDDGRTGIYFGPDPQANALIRTGDLLFGSKVTGLKYYGGLNSVNQLAFAYGLENGHSGVAIATIPEPVLAVIPLAFLAIKPRHRQNR